MDERTRLPFFPVPADGETVFSVVGRCAERLGISNGQLMTFLTEQRYTTTLFAALPGYLKKISAVMPIGHPWQDVNAIVRNHTALRYFSYFHPSEKRLLAAQTLATIDSSQPMAVTAGLSTYRIAAVPENPRFCLACVREHATTLGFAYFQVAHQLPGVFFCWKHGEKLSNGCAHCGLYPLPQKKLSMPGQCLCRSFQARAVSGSQICAGAQWIASNSAYLLKSSDNGEDRHNLLRNAVIEAGLCRGSLINHCLLGEKINAYFGYEFLGSIDYPAFKDGRPSAWLRRFFSHRTEMRRPPTIAGLLISGVALTSIEDLGHGKSISVSMSKHAPIPQLTLQGERWKSELSRVLHDHSFRISACAKALGKTSWAVAIEARNQGLTVPLSKCAVKRIGYDRLDHIKSQIAAGMQKKEIMEEYQLGEWTLFLIELSEPELRIARKEHVLDTCLKRHRHILYMFIEKNPNATRSDVMRNLPGTYDFLISREKSWFQAKIPAFNRKGTIARSRRHDPNELDDSLASRIRQTAARMISSDDKPTRITATALLIRNGSLGRYSAKKFNFPESTQALLEAVESAEDFLYRKVTWAVKQLIFAKEDISLDKLRRKANIASTKLRTHSVEIRRIVSDLGGNVSKKSRLAE